MLRLSQLRTSVTDCWSPLVQASSPERATCGLLMIHVLLRRRFLTLGQGAVAAAPARAAAGTTPRLQIFSWPRARVLISWRWAGIESLAANLALHQELLRGHAGLKPLPARPSECSGV